mgnify:CR=1 FL=1
MAFGIYLMIALLIVACIPLLYLSATWHYLRFGKRIPSFGLTVPWARSALPDRHGPQTTRAGSLFEEDGAHPRPQPHWTSTNLSSIPSEMQSRMKELAIGFDGRQYTFSGYRYDRLPDAINYAELMRSRSALSGKTKE